MCGGVLSAVLSTVAAGSPMMFTLLLKLPLMIPVKGCGSGAGGAAGTITMCVSTAMIWSPCLAAGWPIFFSHQLIFTVAPLMFMVALALRSRPAPASILVSAEDLISIFCASSLIVPCEPATRVMSLLVVIVIVLLAVSKTMLFF